MTKLKIADSFWLRFKGLMFKKNLANREGLLLRPCNGIHTFFMRFNLDILYLDKENNIIKSFFDVSPGKILPVMKECFSVLEIKAGNLPREKELLNMKCDFSKTST